MGNAERRGRASRPVVVVVVVVVVGGAVGASEVRAKDRRAAAGVAEVDANVAAGVVVDARVRVEEAAAASEETVCCCFCARNSSSRRLRRSAPDIAFAAVAGVGVAVIDCATTGTRGGFDLAVSVSDSEEEDRARVSLTPSRSTTVLALLDDRLDAITVRVELANSVTGETDGDTEASRGGGDASASTSPSRPSSRRRVPVDSGLNAAVGGLWFKLMRLGGVRAQKNQSEVGWIRVRRSHSHAGAESAGLEPVQAE